MKNILFTLSFLVLSVVLFAQEDSLERGVPQSILKPGKTPPDIIRAIRYRLEKLDNVYIERLSPRDKRKAREYVDDILRDLDNLAQGIHIVPPPPPPPMAMPPQDFEDFLSVLKKESFDGDKKQMLRIVSTGESFTIDQILAVLQEFVMCNDKIEAVRIMYPSVTDKYNAYKLIQAFTFSSEKEEIGNIIEGKGK